MFKSQLIYLLILLLLLFTLTGTLKVSHEQINQQQHLFQRQINVRNCLQQLNKVIANHNGTFVSGQGYLWDCTNQNVFAAQRGGIILTANCPDIEGNMKTATIYFQLVPEICQDD